MSDLADIGIAEASRRMQAGTLTSTVLTEALLDRIDALNGDLGAFILVMGKTALAQARQADLLRQEGTVLGPLHGVPFAVKDIVDVAGTPTTCHSALMPQTPAARDAAVVERLSAGGAVLLGKLALHEFATGGPTTDLPFPPARNPWNRDLHPGGSSSGSATAVAAGMVPGAIGTDTGGSVRNPATCCGIVGLKPTYGVVSRTGVFPLSFSLDHVGPITREVEDNALLFEAMCTADATDCRSGLDAGVTGLRIGVVRHFHEEAAVPDPEIVAAFESAAETLGQLGASLRPARLSRLEDFAACGRIIQQAEQYVVHKTWLQTRPEAYCRLSREKLFAGALLSAAQYIEALQVRRTLCEAFQHAMAEFDAVIALSSFTLPCRIDDPEAVAATYDKHARMPFNVTGTPALAIPTGLSRTGMPVGMQVAGIANSEPVLFRIAQAYCRASGTTAVHPRLTMVPA